MKLRTRVAVLTAVGCGAVAVAFLNLGGWIYVNDPLPVRMDVIFTFADEIERNIYSDELVRRYDKPTWVLSCSSKEKRLAQFSKDGITPSPQYIVDTCQNTWAEVNFLRAWLADPEHSAKLLKKDGRANPLVVGLVSSPYHMRRIKMMVGRVFRSDTIIFRFLPVPLERYGWRQDGFDKWWENERIRSLCILELKKIVNLVCLHVFDRNVDEIHSCRARGRKQ